jgi:microcystin-dependent protein
MSDGFIGEIRMFGGNFAIRDWAICDGQLLAISSNSALFSILGTTYGGDGRTTFALPDLRGRAPMHAGNGPGLTSRNIGQRGGVETEILSQAAMPAHNHTLSASTLPASSTQPTTQSRFSRSVGGFAYDDTAVANVPLDGGTVGNAGLNQQHNNVQPFLAINYIICLQGIFPSRS